MWEANGLPYGINCANRQMRYAEVGVPYGITVHKIVTMQPD